MGKELWVKVGCAVALVALVAASAMPQAVPSDTDLLAALDAARFPADDISVLRVRITSTTPDGTREAEILLRFARIDGKDYARIEFLAPA